MSKTSVLFVCMGNICRSPTAQGVFERLVREAQLEHRIVIDSAGTHAYHVGNAPDARATEAAARRGVDLSGQRARRIEADDFAQFDYVLAMDHSNLEDLSAISPESYREKPRLFLTFADRVDVIEVPDPYYGGAQGFERVLDLVEEGAHGLLQQIQQQLN